MNFRNPMVVKEFTEVIERFLKAGFKGVRVENGTGLLVDEQYRDESIGKTPGTVAPDYTFYTHSRTTYLEDLGALFKTWRDVIKNETNERVLMLSDDLRKLDPFKINDTLTIDLPKHSRIFVRSLTNATGYTKDAEQIKNDLDAAFRVLENHWPLWETKISSALPDDVMDHVTFFLKGTTLIDAERIVDKDLLTFRKDNPTIMYGTCDTYNVANGSVFAFTR